MTVHHMLLDGWAIGLVLEEIFANYDALEQGRVLELGPAPRIESVLRHQQHLHASGERARQAEFWERHLAGVPTVLDLPADRLRPHTQDPAGTRRRFDAGPAATRQVVERARDLGITPFAFLLGAFGLTLSRYTGAERLLVGVLLAGRTSPELEALVAVAGNLVPVRVDVDDDATVADHLRAVHRSVAQSIEHGGLPFDELVSHLGAGGGDRHPLVQVAFGMHDQLVPQRLGTASLDVRIEEGHGGGSQFDLTLLVRESRLPLPATWSSPPACGIPPRARRSSRTTERLSSRWPPTRPPAWRTSAASLEAGGRCSTGSTRPPAPILGLRSTSSSGCRPSRRQTPSRCARKTCSSPMPSSRKRLVCRHGFSPKQGSRRAAPCSSVWTVRLPRLSPCWVCCGPARTTWASTRRSRRAGSSGSCRACARRRRSPAPRPAAASPSAAGSLSEELVGILFAEVLGRDDIGRDEDFFAAGGDSLRAIRLIGLVRNRLGVALQLRDFFRAPTLSALARLVEQAHDISSSPASPAER